MKKIISIAMSIALILMMAVPARAATGEESYAGNQLRILGILRGYEDGSLKLDQPIVRAEVAALTIRLLGSENKTVEGEGRDFTRWRI